MYRPRFRQSCKRFLPFRFVEGSEFFLWEDIMSIGTFCVMVSFGNGLLECSKYQVVILFRHSDLHIWAHFSGPGNGTSQFPIHGTYPHCNIGESESGIYIAQRYVSFAVDVSFFYNLYMIFTLFTIFVWLFNLVLYHYINKSLPLRTVVHFWDGSKISLISHISCALCLLQYYYIYVLV